MAKNYKVNFDDMRARVGIDDVAYHLGYRLDKRAGVGRYIELVLGEGKDFKDRIIISNPKNKAKQTYFRRGDSKAGSVTSFIKENLDKLPLGEGKNEWQRVANILNHFAGMDPVEYKDQVYVSQKKEETVFNPKRYGTYFPDISTSVPYILEQRGLSLETVQAFNKCFVAIKDGCSNFNGVNIGFPYRESVDGEICGYEIRGTNFKSKAAGTNSNSAAWIADLKRAGGGVDNVYFFESAFDAMACYQANPAIKHQNAAFISVGGTFSDAQILNVLKEFPVAKVWDCFDNDISGRLYGVRLVALASNWDMKYSNENGLYKFNINGKNFELAEKDVSAKKVVELVEKGELNRAIDTLKPSAVFKDWNDMILGKKLEETRPNLVSKFDREKNLKERRSNGFKR